MLVRHFAGMKPANAAFLVTLSSDTNQANLRTLANSAGYSGSGNCTLTLSTTHALYSTSTGTPACVPGSWPSGVIVTLIISSGAFISGMGGAGGTGGNGGAGTAGGAGGTALDASSVSGFTFKVDNQGTIRGGGGGGGGGSWGQGNWFAPGCCGVPQQINGGGGGGGGQGAGSSSGGAGGVTGDGYGYNGNAGTGGSSGGAGGGGSSYWAGPYNGAGGNGGAWGTSGSAGQAGYQINQPGGGGAAGKAVNGNASITWINTGTRTGTIA